MNNLVFDKPDVVCDLKSCRGGRNSKVGEMVWKLNRIDIKVNKYTRHSRNMEHCNPLVDTGCSHRDLTPDYGHPDNYGTNVLLT